jgi:hypothetical protein
MDNLIYVAFDGDGIGNRVGQAILSDNPIELKTVSEKIELGNELWNRWAAQYGGIIYSSGGDQGLYAVKEQAKSNIEEMRRDYEFATGMTVTVGVGRTLSEAGKALLIGKARGKNMIVVYDAIVEQELDKLKLSLVQGTANAEEQKQGNAYFKSEEVDMENNMKINKPQEHDCPYCQTISEKNLDHECPYCAAHNPTEDGHPSDCPYCARLNHNPAEDGHAQDCPYCMEMAEHNPAEDGHSQDCPYCQQSRQNGGGMAGDDQSISPNPPSTQVLPTTQDGENYLGQDQARPSMDKPPAISSTPSGLGINTDVATNENRKLAEVNMGTGVAGGENGSNVIAPGQTVNPENTGTVESILGEIDNIPPNEQAQRTQVNQDDAANMPDGTNMEGNVSRPEGYSQNTPSDLGLGDQHVPDITSVLQEGLDNHADSIQRERVLEMVGQALEGFKACKNIIEKAREQAPQLYASSIAMLKAMIEMAKLLGLDQEQQLDSSPLGSAPPTPAQPSQPQPTGAGSNGPKTLGQ